MPSLFITGGAALSIVHTDADFNSAAAATYTFTSKSLGTVDNTRYIIVGVAATTVPSAVTVAGISATQLVAAGGYCSIWIAAVPSGATGNVVVTAGSSGCAIEVAALYGSNGSASSTRSTPGSLTVPANGAAFGIAYSTTGGGTDALPCSWTGLTRIASSENQWTIPLTVVVEVTSSASLSPSSDSTVTVGTAWVGGNKGIASAAFAPLS